MKISGTIITLNEAERIADCIKNLQQVCDEVVVVDSESTDDTVHIAHSLGAKVVIQKYLGDGPQKHFSAEQASYDWILSIDADERLDDALIKTIQAIDFEDTPHDCFAINRKTFIGDRWAKVWYPDVLVRLYNRKTAGFEKIMGHARVRGQNTKRISGHILHYSFHDYADLMQTTVKFAQRGANILETKNKRVGPLSPLLHSVSGFLRKFILKKGILHGGMGLTISITTAFGTYMKYAIVRERQKQKN
jgi:glycosyltransferase involved in cell wall biosynthesis